MGILSKIREIFGHDLGQKEIKEALRFEENSKLAKIGNDALNLCNSMISYDARAHLFIHLCSDLY
jgi:hypothetical protein